MMYSRSLPFALLLAIVPSALHAQVPEVRSVTLHDVLARAKDNPPAVRAALAQLERVRAEEAYTRGAYIPQLLFEVGSGISYDNRNTTPNKISVPAYVAPGQREAYANALRTPRYEAGSLSSYGRATLDYALLDRARRYAVNASSKRSQTQREVFAGSQREALAAAAELYFQSLAAGELVHDARLTSERRSQQHVAISGLVKAGMKPPVDAMRAEIEVVNAKHALEMREIEEQASFSALAAAIGVDPAQPVRPAAIDDSVWPVPLEPRAATALAIEHRPEVRELEAALEASRAEHRSAIGGRLPTVGVAGTGNVNHAEILSGTGIQGFSYTASASLYLRWAAVDPQVWRRAQVTRAAIVEAERALEATLLQIRAAVYEAAYEVKRMRSLLEQATQVLAAAEVARMAQNQRYRAGVASLLELLDAEGVEQNARRQRIEAERDHHIANARLLAASGMIEQLAR